MKKLKPILILLLYIQLAALLFSCQDLSMSDTKIHEPPAWDESKPYVSYDGTVDTAEVNVNGVVRPGCDQSNGWAACELNTVSDLHPSTVWNNPNDDSCYILTFCDKPNDYFEGELHAVWDYQAGAYVEVCDGVTRVFPNGMSDHYLNCSFTGFPGFSCP